MSKIRKNFLFIRFQHNEKLQGTEKLWCIFVKWPFDSCQNMRTARTSFKMARPRQNNLKCIYHSIWVLICVCFEYETSWCCQEWFYLYIFWGNSWIYRKTRRLSWVIAVEIPNPVELHTVVSCICVTSVLLYCTLIRIWIFPRSILNLNIL